MFCVETFHSSSRIYNEIAMRANSFYHWDLVVEEPGLGLAWVMSHPTASMKSAKKMLSSSCVSSENRYIIIRTSTLLSAVDTLVCLGMYTNATGSTPKNCIYWLYSDPFQLISTNLKNIFILKQLIFWWSKQCEKGKTLNCWHELWSAHWFLPNN